jgi:hypothetical protein
MVRNKSCSITISPKKLRNIFTKLGFCRNLVTFNNVATDHDCFLNRKVIVIFFLVHECYRSLLV